MRCLVAHRIVGVVLGLTAIAWTASGVVQAADVLRVDSEAVAAAHANILKALDAKVKLEFIETPLNDVVDYLKDTTRIEIQFDRKALEDVGVKPDSPVTKNAKDISLRSALRLLLRDLDLTYMIEDEVLLITTPEQADARLELRVYDVSDFPVSESLQKKPVVPGGMGGGFFSVTDAKTDAKPDAKPDTKSPKVPDAPSGKADVKGLESGSCGCRAGLEKDDLLDAIKISISPTTWDTVGGPGSICRLRSAKLDVLIISQTREVHEKIETLLATLRKMRAQMK